MPPAVFATVGVMPRPSPSDPGKRARAATNGQSPASPRPAVALADIETALGYIHRHACEGLTPERTVKETQRVSVATFSRHFRAATGLTLRAAIRQRQVEEVRHLLLRTELTPQFIAEHCGFRDLKSAARAFTAAGSEVPHALRSLGGNPAASSRSGSRVQPN